MKIYVDRNGTAPSPRRVRIYLAEKGLEIPYERLEIHKENRTDEFKKKNRASTLPVLELDDGTCIAESLAICRYFEALHPEPPLFGATPLEQAEIEMWLRRIELRFYLPIEFAGQGVLSSESGALFRQGAMSSMRFFDKVLAEQEFIAGPRYTMADIFTLGAIDFGIAYNHFAIPSELEHFARWHKSVTARPSAAA